MSSSATGAVSAPLASSARSEATTVGSIGSECTVISSTTQTPAARSSTPTEIERASDAECADDRDVLSGELAEMVGTEDVAPARGATVACGVAAEVAKIAGALQGEVTGRGV